MSLVDKSVICFFTIDTCDSTFTNILWIQRESMYSWGVMYIYNLVIKI